MSADIVVETHQLTKCYGKQRTAVNNLNLRICQGEVFGFLGPNGAGKTTTIRMILGLIRPTAGTALVLGAKPGKATGIAHVGSLVESPAFYPYLSGRDNLRVLSRYAGLPPLRIENALAQVGLSARAAEKVATYSLGMKQRLGVAVALLKEPTLLILDEPTNGLDPQGVTEMRELIRRLGRGKRTVLLSSHLLSEVEQVCDRVGVIQHGVLVTEGTVAELCGATALIVRADPTEQARGTMIQLLGGDAVDVADGLLRLAVGPERAAEVVRCLVNSGIDVSEVRPMRHSLEEIFFALTTQEGPR
jgi:ABC-type multidrug transport system ATPase subunit